MSDVQTMRGLLQARLLTIGWENQTEFEGKHFSPTDGVPYQELTTVFVKPESITLAGSTQRIGTFQVRILWPLTKADGSGTAQAGIGAPTARAQAIADAFPRNLILPVGGPTQVKIMDDAHITRGPPQGDRDVTIVQLRFSDR